MLKARFAPRRQAQPHRKTLRLFLRIWTTTRSGVLRLDSGGEVRFIGGEPLTPEDLRACVRVLKTGGGGVFVNQRMTVCPPIPVMARTLWNAASILAETQKLPLRGPLVPSPAARRISAFPLCEASSSWLRESNNLDTLIRQRPLEREAIRRDLRILVALGVYRVRNAKPKSREDEPCLNPRNAFSVGCDELEGGRYSNAVKAFALLKQAQPYNARGIAWLGFALTKDPNFPERQRRARGRRFLEEAEGLGCVDAKVLLARLDVDEGEPGLALSRLQRVVLEHPHDSSARVLLDRVQNLLS